MLLYLAILVLLVVVPGIVVAILKRERQRKQADFVTIVSEALSNSEYSRALALIREFLCAPMDIESVWGVFRNNMVDNAVESLQAQMNAAGYLPEIYKLAATPIPQDLLKRLPDRLLASVNLEVLQDDGLFSLVIGSPKKEFAQAFQAAQHDKEQFVRLLPELS